MTREKWGRPEWAATIIFLLIFPPIGIAALARWLLGQRVWE